MISFQLDWHCGFTDTYVAQAGHLPHLPEDGKIVAFKEKSSTTTPQAATGAPLLVDVEFGRGRNLYGLSQGIHTDPVPGTPADPNTGSLVEAKGDGTFATIVGGLNQPTSMEFIGNTAYVVTLNGDIYKIANVSAPPYGMPH